MPRVTGKAVFVIISAVILAFACALLLFSNRGSGTAGEVAPDGLDVAAPQSQDQPQVVFVEGLAVTLATDPEKAVLLLGAAPPPQAVVPEVITDPGQAPATATPLPALPTVVPTAIIMVTLPPTAVPPPPTAVVPPVIFINYTVQPDDTLYNVASEQNSSIELMALHGIDADDLVAGTVLELPIANPAYCPGSRPYIVRDKDTVFRIAVQFNTGAEVLRQMNGLGADYGIRVTQVICVP